jgi:hypothetical protein
LIFPERSFPVLLKRFYTAVVHRRRAVLAAFVLAAVLSVFASRAVQHERGQHRSAPVHDDGIESFQQNRKTPFRKNQNCLSF